MVIHAQDTVMLNVVTAYADARALQVCHALREISGGQRVVTNEHLVKACHYFDVRILVADVDYVEPNPPGSYFFRDYYDDVTREGITQSPQTPSDNQLGPGSLRQTERQRDRKRAASPTMTTTAIGKRKTSDDEPSANSVAESRKARRST
ncbi:hypothetical protein FBULB1_12414 [Fusarium bulbicola]|nr:hypothetical protein FBULB1_12414 [Fusarium bulbicola]